MRLAAVQTYYIYAGRQWNLCLNHSAAHPPTSHSCTHSYLLSHHSPTQVSNEPIHPLTHSRINLLAPTHPLSHLLTKLLTSIHSLSHILTRPHPSTNPLATAHSRIHARTHIHAPVKHAFPRQRSQWTRPGSANTFIGKGFSKHR